MAKAKMLTRERMIVEIPIIVQMAIRLRAAKTICTTGEIVTFAILDTYPEEIREASKAVKLLPKKGKKS